MAHDLIQSAIKNNQKKLKNTSTPTPKSSLKMFSIYMELFEIDSSTETTSVFLHDLGSATHLSPGKAYRLNVGITHSPIHNQTPLIISREVIELRFSMAMYSDVLKEVPAYELPIGSSITWVVNCENLEGAEHTLDFILPNPCPGGEYQIVINCGQKYTDNQMKPKRVASMNIRIEGQGTRYSVPLEAVKFHISMDEASAENSALMIVTRVNDSRIRIRGIHSEAPLKSQDQNSSHELEFVFEKTDIADLLSKLRPGQLQEYRNLIDYMDSIFSYKIPHELIRWLLRLLSDEKPLNLMIVDYAYLNIPWELLKLEVTSPKQKSFYLGQRVVITRWIALASNSEEYPKLHWGKNRFQGKVAYYLDDTSMTSDGWQTSVTKEQKLLSRFRRHLPIFPDGLINQLDQSLDAVGLLYIGCHGYFEYNKDPYIYMGDKVYWYNILRISRRSGKRPIAFINACHSARLDQDGNYRPTGLPVAFLSKIVDAYIGTLGPVGSAYAVELAENLLSAIRINITPAEFLRSWREEVTHDLDFGSRESVERFLHAYLYVYYGNPLATLNLELALTEGSENYD